MAFFIPVLLGLFSPTLLRGEQSRNLTPCPPLCQSLRGTSTRVSGIEEEAGAGCPTSPHGSGIDDKMDQMFAAEPE
jgi:hypothetical protein